MRTVFLFFCSVPIYFMAGLFIQASFKLDYSTPAPVLVPLLGGFIVGLLFFFFINKLTPVYIFGHELAHWIFAKIFLRETGRFSLGQKEGAVEIKNPNIWISLAPYFYPTFTVMWIPFWFIFKYFDKKYEPSLTVYFTVLAVTWAYHVAMTIYALKFEQSDFKKYGRPLSLSIILLMNMLTIFSFLTLLTNGMMSGMAVLKEVCLLNCMKIFELCQFFLNLVT